MSTKALWKALEAAFDHPNADGEVCRAARDELEAIEQACRDWYAQETRRGVVLASDALAPFERIALETKP